MFSLREKREISYAVQGALKKTKHPELPEGEISFILHVKGADAESWSWIENNGAVINPNINPHNEMSDGTYV